MCREPGWHNTLHSSEHADKSDAGIRDCDASQRGLLVRATVYWPRGKYCERDPASTERANPSLDGSGAWTADRLMYDTAATGAMN